MAKIMIYGPGIDLYKTITDDQAEKIYLVLLNMGIINDPTNT